jgi:hypothetical protein
MNPDSSIWASLAIGLPTDVTLLKATTELQYENKEVADETTGLLVRHISFIDSSKIDKPMNLTDGVLAGAYYLPKNANVVFMGEVINSSKEVKRVMVVTDVEFIAGKVESTEDKKKQMIAPVDSIVVSDDVLSDFEGIATNTDSDTETNSDFEANSDFESNTDSDSEGEAIILTPVAGGPDPVQKPLNGGFAMFDRDAMSKEAAV